MEILVEGKNAFKIGAAQVTRILISKINFVNYAECFKERLLVARRGGDDVAGEKAFKRARRLIQVSAFGKDGAALKLTHEVFGAMPRKLFVQIDNALDVEDVQAGKVISENADGISSPIIYSLGTPLAFDDANASAKPIGTEQKIIELEFLAKTGGDIEEVLCHGTTFEQMIALMKTCATPLGGGSTGLLRMPSWMIDGITSADGFAMMASVLPLFTE